MNTRDPEATLRNSISPSFSRVWANLSPSLISSADVPPQEGGLDRPRPRRYLHMYGAECGG